MRNREDLRRTANLVLVWFFWTSATALTLSITLVDAVSRDWGVLVVLLMGGGVTSSLIRSRYRLSDAISQVFQVGVEVGRQQQEDEDQSQ